MEPKNQVIKTTPCKVMAKYISTYLDISIKNKNIFSDDMHWITYGLDSPLRNPLKKRFLSENVIFRGLRLSLGHFGRQAPESSVSQLQNGVSPSSKPPFIVDLLTFNSFFSSVRSSNSHPDLLLIHHPTPLFQI